MNVAAGSGMPASVVLFDSSFPPHPTTALPNARMIAVVLSMSCPPLLKALNNINGSHIGAVTMSFEFIPAQESPARKPPMAQCQVARP